MTVLQKARGLPVQNAMLPPTQWYKRRISDYQKELSGGPAQDRGGDLVGSVELGEMAGARNRHNFGPAGERRGEAAGVAARHDPVLFAPDQQGRGGNQRQSLFEPGVAERPEGAGRRLGGAHLFDWPFRRVGALGLGLELVPAFRVGAQQTWHLGRALRPRVG